MNIINSIPRRAPEIQGRLILTVSREQKELWSWNKNQNVAHELMKAATMVLNILHHIQTMPPITVLVSVASNYTDYEILKCKLGRS